MWWQLGLNIAIALISTLFYKPPPGPKSKAVSDLRVPKSEEGAVIYDAAGTVWIEDAHVVWYGDFSNKPIYKEGGKK